MKLGDLQTPAFVINRYAFEKNCRKVVEMAKLQNFKIRPHIKTHKTVQGCLLQATWDSSKDILTGFVASTIPEIAMLVKASEEHQGPFRDILYGVPISYSKLPILEKLRNMNCRIHIMIDHPLQVSFINDFMSSLPPTSTPLSAFVKLDTGYHRAGIPCDDRGVDLVKLIENSPYILLFGIYSHWYVVTVLAAFMTSSAPCLNSPAFTTVGMPTMKMTAPS